ncbi:MAG: hypothetical protein LBR96_07040 [Treponema sp.]|nr:hypothetical protein [Treponema sp.]
MNFYVFQDETGWEHSGGRGFVNLRPVAPPNPPCRVESGGPLAGQFPAGCIRQAVSGAGSLPLL